MILVVVSVAQLMVVLDSTIVNIALPSAQLDLGFADSQRQWIVTAYALAFGSLLLLGGRVGDLLGRKRTFLIGLIVFAVASAVGGAADSFGLLVAARALQGVGGAILAPAALAVIVTTFLDPRDRGRAFGVFGSVAISGGAIGLLLGGLLTQYLSWRWTMYVNVAFAATAALGALFYMRGDHPTARPRLDIGGTTLISGGLLCLVYGFSHAETAGWSSRTTVATLALGALLVFSFVLVERVAASPLLPLRVVTDRTRAIAYVLIWVAGVAMFSTFLFLTFHLQLAMDMSPVISGLAFLPLMGIIAISANLASMVGVPRFGPRAVITTGLVTCAIGLALLSRLHVDSSYAGGVLPGLLGLGLGVGMVVPPSMNLATAGVEPSDAGVASAMANTVQQIGGSVGVAVLGTISASLASGYTRSHPGEPMLDLVAITHGYAAAFAIAAALFALAAIGTATMLRVSGPGTGSKNTLLDGQSGSSVSQNDSGDVVIGG